MSDQEFDTLMDSMGVKRQKKGEQPVRKPQRRIVRPKVEGAEAPAKAAAPVDAAPPQPDPQRLKAEAALADARVELQSLTEELSGVRAELARMEAEASAPAAEVPTVAETLSGLGFITPDEQASLLGQDGMLGRVLSLATLAEPAALEAWIEERIVRLCSSCKSPSGRDMVLVAANRCESCGGEDLPSAARRFVDACLIQGRLRIVFIGRSPKHQRMLRAAVEHKRLVLTHVAATSDRAPAQARTDVANADAVVLWDADGIPASIRGVYEDAERCVIAGPVCITELLRRAAEAIGAD